MWYEHCDGRYPVDVSGGFYAQYIFIRRNPPVIEYSHADDGTLNLTTLRVYPWNRVHYTEAYLGLDWWSPTLNELYKIQDITTITRMPGRVGAESVG